METKIPGWLLGAAGVALFGAAWWWHASNENSVPKRAAQSPSDATQLSRSDSLAGAAEIARDRNASTGSRAGRPSAQTLVQVLPVIESALPDIAAFRAWARQYFQTTDPAEQAALIPEGTRLAEAHRQALKSVISSDPRAALEQAVPMVVRQALPQAVTDHLEARLSGVGAYDVLAVSPDSDPSEPTVRRFATLNATEYRAHIYGRRDSQMSTSQAMLNGIAVDREFAVNESPVRPLETGEVPDATKQAVEVCPVSGEKTEVSRTESGALPPVAPETPALEAGSQIIYLCDGGHIRQYEEEILAGEGATGGPGAPTGTFPITRIQSTGVRKFIYMRLVFPDRLQEPQNEKDAQANVKSITDYFQELSYGKLTFMGTVTPLILLPRTAAWYAEDYNVTGSNSPIMNDAKEAARKLGFPSEDFNHFVVIYAGGPGSFGGLGSVNGPNTWLKSTNVGVADHELGHNVGVWHSNSWNTGGVSVIGAGANVEYGHTNDVMGASGSNGHFNASMKEQLQWLTPETYHTVRSSGIFRLYQFDQVRQDPARRYALKVAKDADRDYWLEFRQKLSANSWYMNGVTVNWSPWGYGSGADNGTTRGSNRGTQLLDMTPGSPDDRTDAPLVIGRTFSDFESDVHITPIGKGGTVPESMDVVVNTGTMAAGNQPPTLSLGASATSVTVGTPVTLTATSTDPDGDTLAYAWEFGDATNSFSTNNGASQSKSFSSAGRYLVRCSVSDMKGGSSMRSVLITVGGSVAPIITGTVLDGSGNPIANARVHNGLTLANYRGGFTDSAGAYTVTNIGTTTPLTVVKEGWTFTVPPDGPVQNFTGTEGGVQLTIQAIDSDAGEGGNTGVFRISRTGATTTALTVYTDFAGTASLGGDYTLSPAAVTTASPLETFTVPIGSSFLDITVSVTDDSSQEGPEAVVMALINGSNAYVIRGSQTAQVNISDNDTSLPQVSLEVVDAEATENVPSDKASFRVSRTGSTSNSLTVNLTVDASPGTAANGTDYASIGTSVVIPAGSASALLEVSPINDSLVEGMELVTLTIASSSSAYVRSAFQFGSVKINDDDIATVTLAVTDSTANENGDPARFTITRTGDLANALLVHYAISGTATHGADYLALPGFVTIPAGSASAVVDIIPIEDAHGEPAQTVILQLRSSTLYTVGTSSNATATINDDNDLPVVAVTLYDGSVAEGSSPDPGTFRLVTTGTGSGNITVNYTISGTAFSGSDFTSLTGSVSMGRNTTADIVVTPLNDSLMEDAESVTLTLQSSSSYQVDLQDQSTMMIKDDDSPSMVSVTATTTSVGEGGTGKINISRTGSTASAITVGLAFSGTATSGSDYSGLPSTVSLAAGVATASLSVSAIDDSSPEGVESLVVSLLPDSTSPALYGRESGVTTLLITDNDTGFTSNVGFAQTSRIVDESAGVVSLAVTRSGSTAGIATVDYTVYAGSALGSGVDYRLAAGTLTFPAGATSASIPVQIMDDVLPEDVETAVVILQNASQAAVPTSTSQCTVMILDNEPRVSIEATDPIAYENGGNNAALKVSRTGSTDSVLTVPLVVSGTATSGSDYTALPASVTLPAGAEAYFLSVAPVQDATQESVETVTVTLGPSGSFLPGDQSAASVSIGDAVANNPPLLALLSPRGTGQGVPLSTALWIDVMASDDGRPGPVTYSWAKQSGPGSVTFSSSTSASTAASFSLAGAYVLRLTASDGTLTSTLDASIFVGAPVDPWTNTDIGAVSLPGSGVDADDVHAVNGNGSWVWNASDNVFFRYRHLVGNGEISARVRQMPNTSTSARVGVMLRESTAVGAKMAGMYMAPATANLSASHVRTSVGGSVVSTSNAGLSPSYWVKVVRNSGILTTFDSPDGNEWTQRGSSTAISFADDILAGIAVVSANTTRLSTALVDNVRITGAPENNGPAVNAGPDGDASVNTPRTLTGSASDGDARPAVPGAVSVQWTQVAGPPGASFANAAAANTTVTLPQGGVYVLRLTADDGAVKTCDEVALTVQDALVNVGVSADPAFERGLVPATFTFARSGYMDGPLTVNFSLAGSTATSGADYTSAGASVTIPAGQASVDLVIAPLADDLAEGNETVELQILPGTGYHAGEYASATHYIFDLPVDDWRYQQFGPNANSPDSAPLADYDHDGVPNLLEYAFHSDPTQPGANLPVPDQQGNSLSIIFTRDKWAYDLEYHVEWSPDLAAGHWYETGVTESVTPIDLQYETVRATYTPSPPDSRCFMRVRIVAP